MNDYEYYKCQCGRNHPVGVKCAIGLKNGRIFTQPEINHLLRLLNNNEEDGIHTLPAKHYWKRSERIKQKLETEALARADAQSHND